MEEAIDLAVMELGVDRDEIVVDVVSAGRAGILGIGAEPAKVRVRLIGDESAAAAAGLSAVSNLLGLLGVEATASIRSSGSGPDDPAVNDVQGEDAGLLIGRRGETLRALQFVINMMLTRGEEPLGPVVVDVEQYRRRRAQELRRLAERTARRAVSTGRSVHLDPMPPADRRIVHMALADSSDATTESAGEGADRHVVVSPIADQPGAREGRGRRAQ
ncbi:MAG: Jag N-terminal domain-containing protein [Chloroflexota bacterium]|nr:Jag N-terminal domain-containing protein [Chloroflexota bacterium]